MSVSSSELSDGKIVLKILGNLDTYKASIEFKDALEETFSSGKREVVLDLDAVEKINSFGTGKILMFYRRFKSAGGEMYVKVPLHGEVQEVFNDMKIDKLLKNYSI